MDNSKKTQVFKELASYCKKEKSKWALAAFDEGWKSASVVKEGSVPVPVVEQVVVRPEEGVVNPPRLFEIGGRPIPESWNCSVNLVPVSLSVFSFCCLWSCGLSSS